MTLKEIIRKIWEASPKSIYLKLKKICAGPNKKQSAYKTVKVKSVYAGDIYLAMPEVIPETYLPMIDGTYEKFMMDIIVAKISMRKKIVWDIGAHIGFQSFSFASMVGPKGKIVAFEPNPNNIDWFKRNLKVNPDLAGRIILCQEVLSDKREILNFKISKITDDATTSGGFIDSITPPLPDSSYENFSLIHMQAVTIDELTAKEELPIPDIIKIDVEGAELNVLMGAEETIKTNKPIFLIEIHTIPMMFYIMQFLTDRGYKIDILDENDNNIFTKVIYAEYKN